MIIYKNVQKSYGDREIIRDVNFTVEQGEFVVMKTGTHPMRTRLRLFLDWGITFDPDGYRMPERAARKISYVDQGELVRSIHRSCTKSPYNMEGGR